MKERKRVLLTGSGGFIGAHCVEYFLDNTEWDLVCLDSFRHKGTHRRTQDVVSQEKLNRAMESGRLVFVKHDLSVPLDPQLENLIMNRRIDPNTGRVVEDKLHYIINMASESAVERSVEDPVPCLRNNYELVINMLEFARRIKPDIFYQVSCYDAQTRVMTPDGFKYYSDLLEGEKILSLNTDTGFLEEKIIQKIIVQDYCGEMYCFNKSRTDLSVTPNHRMLYENQNGGIQIGEVKELCEKSYYYRFPKAKWSGKSVSQIFVDGVGYVDAGDLFYLCGLFIGDGFCDKQIQSRYNKTGLKREEFLKRARDESGRFFKIGKIGTVDMTDCVSWRIWFDIPENDLARPKLCSVLERMGVKYSEQCNKSGEHVYITSEAWVKFFKKFGKYARNKHIPKWMLEYNPDLLSMLLEGLIDSDGHLGGSMSYSTCSERLVRDVCELSIKLGYFPHFTEKHTEAWLKKEQRVIRGHGYNITICKQHPVFDQRRLVIEEYDGKVWCLKVEDNRNLIVERNGKIVICGNTDEVYGEAQPDQAHVEWDVIVPSNPYAASKAAQEAVAISYWRSYDVPVVLTNTMNNFAEAQDPEKFIPKIVKMVASGNEMPVYADHVGPDRTVAPSNHKEGEDYWNIGARFYLHAKNHADVFVFLSQFKPAMYRDGAVRPDRYNVCGDVEFNNLEMAQLVAKFMGRELKYKLVPSESARKGYDRRYALDGTRLRKMGWKMPLTFEESIEQVVRWTLNNPHWAV